MGILEAKKELRDTIKEKLLKLSGDEKDRASSEILHAILILKAFREAHSIMAYASLDSEVDTLPLMELILKEKKELWLPWCSAKSRVIVPVKINNLTEELKSGAYGIASPREPQEKTMPNSFKPDVVFVPGLAFDKKGGRLGRGLAYYDKFLSALDPKVQKIGLAFECQIAGEVPREPSDIKVDQVISA